MFVRTTTANPYGHRPWQTRLYTTFEKYAWLKQPQNWILREPRAMQPRIYKPPEMSGMGMTIYPARDGWNFGLPDARPLPYSPVPAPKPPTILPPTSVPVPARTVVTPAGTINIYLPGAPGAAGTPFPPAAPAESGVPAASSPAAGASLTDWFKGETQIAGMNIPNWGIVAAAAGAAFFFSRKGGR